MKHLNYYENFASMNTTVLGLKDAWMGCLKNSTFGIHINTSNKIGDL